MHVYVALWAQLNPRGKVAKENQCLKKEAQVTKSQRHKFPWQGAEHFWAKEARWNATNIALGKQENAQFANPTRRIQTTKDFRQVCKAASLSLDVVMHLGPYDTAVSCMYPEAAVSKSKGSTACSSDPERDPPLAMAVLFKENDWKNRRQHKQVMAARKKPSNETPPMKRPMCQKCDRFRVTVEAKTSFVCEDFQVIPGPSAIHTSLLSGGRPSHGKLMTFAPSPHRKKRHVYANAASHIQTMR